MLGFVTDSNVSGGNENLERCKKRLSLLLFVVDMLIVFRGDMREEKRSKYSAEAEKGKGTLERCEQTEPVVGETTDCISFVKSWRRSDRN